MNDNEQDSATAGVDSSKSSEIPVHFIKGANFRVIHADGVWFGGSPFGGIHLTFYNERFPIPSKIIVQFDPKGQATENESKREVKAGFVREMEVDIVLSLQAALALQQSLAINIEMMQNNAKQEAH